MNNDSGRSISYWMSSADIPAKPALKEDLVADVCIVGAGISGLTTAYFLLKEGKSVVILDDGPIAGGESGRTTAHFSNAFDDRYYHMKKMHGEEGIRILGQSHSAAIGLAEKIIKEENIDCDYTRLDGYLFLAPDHKEDILNKELEAAHLAGLKDVVKLTSAQVGSFSLGPCLKFPDQLQLHPMKYFGGIANAIERMGGKIYCKTHVNTVKGGKNAFVVADNGVNVHASAIVVATNSPINNLFNIHTKQAAYRTYVIAAKIPKGSIPLALYWDTADPYHYIRLQQDDDIISDFEYLIIGGEDHKTGQEENTEKHFRNLELWARERFNFPADIEFKWSGQVMEPVDGVAFIGKNPNDDDNVYVITGDYGNGMTHGTLAGLLITDLIMGRPNEWEKLYSPSRITLAATGEFLKENLNVAAQYGKWIKEREVNNVTEIPKESGAIMRNGLSKIAVYKDGNGGIHQHSAVCTHLGCIVQWNDTEKSWDCPCHGSRYTALGKVINGPAINDLEAIDVAKVIK